MFMRKYLWGFQWLATIFLTGMVLLWTGCEKTSVTDCFVSTGKVIKTERYVSAFHAVVLKDNVNLYLRQADTARLVLEAGSNLMRKIYTEVKDSVLYIGNNNSCNWVRSYNKPVNVFLDFTRFDSLEYRSIGNVENFDTLRLDSLKIEVKEGAGLIALIVDIKELHTNLHYGTADLKMSGKCTLSYVYSAGFGLIDNRNLEARQIYADNKSSNDVYLNSTEVLEVTIHNIGNVYYTGNPGKIKLNRIGTGELIRLE